MAPAFDIAAFTEVGHQNAYYSPGLTTVASAYDYWIGGNALRNGPPPVVTGSDHRGAWINLA